MRHPSCSSPKQSEEFASLQVESYIIIHILTIFYTNFKHLLTFLHPFRKNYTKSPLNPNPQKAKVTNPVVGSPRIHVLTVPSRHSRAREWLGTKDLRTFHLLAKGYCPIMMPQRLIFDKKLDIII